MKKRYKFLREGLKSDNGKNRDWKIGEWRKEENIKICESGFHCSKTPLQAFGYVQGEILAEVEVRGECVEEKDKECYSEMRIVKAWHWTKEDSVVLAIFSAEQVIKNYEKVYPNDDRPRKAIEAAKAYLKDPNEKNRSAAWSAARSAAESARSAAESAAWSAARSAVESAWSAAESAAWSAARSAAESAESAARSARSAAESAMFKRIDKWFVERIKTLKSYE